MQEALPSVPKACMNFPIRCEPVGYFAAALIDECGLKGLSVGGAQVSEKHAGFIVNIGGATCEDIVALADKVRQIVFEKKGVVLEKEMIIV